MSTTLFVVDVAMQGVSRGHAVLGDGNPVVGVDAEGRLLTGDKTASAIVLFAAQGAGLLVRSVEGMPPAYIGPCPVGTTWTRLDDPFRVSALGAEVVVRRLDREVPRPTAAPVREDTLPSAKVNVGAAAVHAMRRAFDGQTLVDMNGPASESTRVQPPTPNAAANEEIRTKEGIQAGMVMRARLGHDEPTMAQMDAPVPAQRPTVVAPPMPAPVHAPMPMARPFTTPQPTPPGAFQPAPPTAMGPMFAPAPAAFVPPPAPAGYPVMQAPTAMHAPTRMAAPMAAPSMPPPSPAPYVHAAHYNANAATPSMAPPSPHAPAPNAHAPNPRASYPTNPPLVGGYVHSVPVEVAARENARAKGANGAANGVPRWAKLALLFIPATLLLGYSVRSKAETSHAPMATAQQQQAATTTAAAPAVPTSQPARSGTATGPATASAAATATATAAATATGTATGTGTAPATATGPATTPTPAAGDAPALSPSFVPLLPEEPPVDVVAERRVAEAMFAGDYAKALDECGSLAAAHPSTPRYGVMLRVLRAKTARVRK